MSARGESFTAKSAPTSLWAAWSRSGCSECGAAILWGAARDLAWHIGLSDRLRVVELVNMVGPDADAWRCTQCSAWGVFDSAQAFFD